MGWEDIELLFIYFWRVLCIMRTLDLSLGPGGVLSLLATQRSVCISVGLKLPNLYPT